MYICVCFNSKPELLWSQEREYQNSIQMSIAAKLCVCFSPPPASWNLQTAYPSIKHNIHYLDMEVIINSQQNATQVPELRTGCFHLHELSFE